ncbi:ABC transporter permease [Maritimibacter alexandrii]|uniref:ABC transporter permease n=1 Tax=Maritimibacter alexandrii TaxID=2570355 RepID=UPI001F1BE018|nr:ABC transporter permease [Maritimibacter alexandrii]
MAKSPQKAALRAHAFRGFLMAWWLPVLAVVAWYVLSASSTSFYFPPLSKILAVLWRDLTDGPLLGYMFVSLSNMAVGLALAILIGVGTGLYIGDHAKVRQAAMPMLNFLRSVPPAAIVPIVIIALGIGAAPKIFIIAFTCLWPILLNTIDGVRGMPEELSDTARAFRIPRGLTYRRVLLMASLPQIMAGIRVAIAVALVLMVISEFFGASAGLGFYINENKQRFAMVETWAGTILIGVLGYVLSAVFLQIERVTLRWYFREAGAQTG